MDFSRGNKEIFILILCTRFPLQLLIPVFLNLITFKPHLGLYLNFRTPLYYDKESKF